MSREENECLSINFLIGTKIDLVDGREVSYEGAEQFAKKINFEYIECSCLTGCNVEEAMLLGIRKLNEEIDQEIELSKKETSDVQDPLKTQQPRNAKQKKCLVQQTNFFEQHEMFENAENFC
jgi:GTPase SAR1 family protein